MEADEYVPHPLPVARLDPEKVAFALEGHDRILARGLGVEIQPRSNFARFRQIGLAAQPVLRSPLPILLLRAPLPILLLRAPLTILHSPSPLLLPPLLWRPKGGGVVGWSGLLPLEAAALRLGRGLVHAVRIIVGAVLLLVAGAHLARTDTLL